jgi:hypothetical protein
MPRAARLLAPQHTFLQRSHTFLDKGKNACGREETLCNISGQLLHLLYVIFIWTRMIERRHWNARISLPFCIGGQ